MKILRILVANIVAVWLAHLLVTGFSVSGEWKGYVIGGILLGILNLLAKPVLRFVSAPIIWLTLGLFTLVINGFLIWVVAYFSSYVSVGIPMPLVWATLIITAVNFIASGFKA